MSPHAEDGRWPRKTSTNTSNANALDEDSILAEATAIMSDPDAVLARTGYLAEVVA